MAAKRLPQALALRVAAHCKDCLHRAGATHSELVASHPAEGFERVYDTLALELKRPPDARQSKINPQSSGELVREALLLLRALSACAGFGFHENFSFWNSTLAEESAGSGAHPVLPNLRFPRVVLDWNPHEYCMYPHNFDCAASLTGIKTTVLALFTTPSDRKLSKDGESLMAEIRASCSASRTSKLGPVDCVVSIRFARSASDTKALVDVVRAATTALKTSSPVQSEFVWCGVYITGTSNVEYVHHGLVSLANLRLLSRLSASLPASMSFDFALPRSDAWRRTSPTSTRSSVELLKAPLVSFVTHAIGVAGTELLGRLTVLDLTHNGKAANAPSAFDFASLCTLLPLSRTLQTLYVAVTTHSDLLWIAYAAMHPLTPTTRWRTLHLDSQNDVPLECPAFERLVESSAWLATLWSELTHSTCSKASPDDAFPGFRVRRTAKIARNVQISSPDKTRTIAQLVRGCDVELCDTATDLYELGMEHGDPDLDNVAVVVAGVGLGWVNKRHLSQITDTRYDGAQQPYLTTLVLSHGAAAPSELPEVLSFFGPALIHLRVAESVAVAVRDVAHTCPHLQSLEMAVAQWQEFDSTESPAMPTLRYVGLNCDDLSLSSSFQWLQSLPVLTTLRFLVSTYAEWSEIDLHLEALVAAKTRTLRSVTVVHPAPENQQTFGRDDRLSCEASSKRAFMSVIRRTQGEQGLQSAIAQLGSDVVRLIFDFAGPSLTQRVVEGDSLWPFGWYDTHRRRRWASL